MNYIKKLYKICDIEYINILIETIKIKDSNKRKPKYFIEHYLYYIFLILTDLQTWKSLTYIFDDSYKPNHYKTIQAIHNKWSRLNIYKIAYNTILNKYKISKLKQSSNLILFIDSSNIYNKNGSENIGYGMNPKKKESRISAICDKDKNVY